MFQSPQKTIKWFTVISCPNISQQKYLSQQTYQTSSTFSFITYMYIATARCREVFPAYYRWFYLICPDFKIVSIYLGLAKNIVAFYFQEIIPFIELVGVFETYFKLNSPRFFRWIMNDIYIYLYTLHIQHHIFVRWTSSWPCWFPSAAWTSRPVAWRWRAGGDLNLAAQRLTSGDGTVTGTQGRCAECGAEGEGYHGEGGRWWKTFFWGKKVPGSWLLKS